MPEFDLNTKLEKINIAPEQLAMFEPDESGNVTRMEIPHVAADLPAVESSFTRVPEGNTATEEIAEESDSDLNAAKKIKILAALAIVAVAGYAAYWVQEPVQIKADVLGTENTAPEGSATEDANASAVMTADASLGEEEPTSTAMDAATSPSVNVDVSLFGFEPATLKIDKGTTVIWTNTSTEDQTIVGSSEDGQSFVSPVLTSGDSFEYAFDQDALFQYYSTYNPALKASITVGLGTSGAAGATEAVSAPDSAAPATTTSGTPASTTTLGADGTGATSPLEEGILETQTKTSQNDSATALVADAEKASDADINPEDDNLKPAAAGNSPTGLTKTGPEDWLYLALLAAIVWFNRKPLRQAFGKNA